MRKAFTLIELLVVLAISAMLLSILIPVLTRASERGRQTACISNLHQVYIAYQMYAQDYDCEVLDVRASPASFCLPARYWKCPDDPNPDVYNADGSSAASYGQILFAPAGDGAPNDPGYSSQTPFLLCAHHHTHQGGVYIVCTLGGTVYRDPNPCQPRPDPADPHAHYPCVP